MNSWTEKVSFLNTRIFKNKIYKVDYYKCKLMLQIPQVSTLLCLPGNYLWILAKMHRNFYLRFAGWNLSLPFSLSSKSEKNQINQNLNTHFKESVNESGRFEQGLERFLKLKANSQCQLVTVCVRHRVWETTGEVKHGRATCFEGTDFKTKGPLETAL